MPINRGVGHTCGVTTQRNPRRPGKKDVLTHVRAWADLEASTLEGSNSVTRGQTLHGPNYVVGHPK